MAICSLVVAELVVGALGLSPEQLNAVEVWSVWGVENQFNVEIESCISGKPSPVDCGIVQEDGNLLDWSEVLSHILEDVSHVCAKEGCFLVCAVNQANLLANDSASFQLLDRCPSLSNL